MKIPKPSTMLSALLGVALFVVALNLQSPKDTTVEAAQTLPLLDQTVKTTPETRNACECVEGTCGGNCDDCQCDGVVSSPSAGASVVQSSGVPARVAATVERWSTDRMGRTWYHGGRPPGPQHVMEHGVPADIAYAMTQDELTAAHSRAHNGQPVLVKASSESGVRYVSTTAGDTVCVNGVCYNGTRSVPVASSSGGTVCVNGVCYNSPRTVVRSSVRTVSRPFVRASSRVRYRVATRRVRGGGLLCRLFGRCR